MTGTELLSQLRERLTGNFTQQGLNFEMGLWVEVFVKKFKRTLKHRFSNKFMYVLELQASFKVVASILNSRPIYARWGNRVRMIPIFCLL